MYLEQIDQCKNERKLEADVPGADRSDLKTKE